MKRILPLAFAMAVCGQLSAQRFLTEVFTGDQITVTSDVIYGVNVDFLTSKLSPANMATIAANMAELHNIVNTGGTIPAVYFNPADTNTTKVKVANLRMDIYQPDPAVDSVEDRPVVLYLHTGNALPPPVNGSPNGTRKDSSAVEMCKQLAKRGYVAVSMSYRLGWNPLGSSIEIRRGTLLNAIYRAIHDVRQCVRTLKEDADGPNTYGIDVSKIVVIGEGTGGYIALANATLNRSEELYIDKFLINPAPPVSYVDTTMVGNLNGFNGFFSLYRANGFDHATHFCANMGGSLADTSWLEPGDVPMVSFHTVFDPFAPFTEGIVIVPTTQEQVVEVQGGNLFMGMVNGFGNNSSFVNLNDEDPFTVRARSLYGTTQVHGDVSVTINSNGEGLFPMVRPMHAPPFSEEASPWQWWDPSSPIAQTVVLEGPPAITAHVASLMSNPDMSPEKGRAYIDTIQGYLNPRIVCALQLGPCNLVGISEKDPIAAGVDLYPNPANDVVTISSSNAMITRYEVLDINGRLLRTSTVNRDRIEMQRDGLASGVYFVKLHFKEGTVTRKLVMD